MSVSQYVPNITHMLVNDVVDVFVLLISVRCYRYIFFSDLL